MVEPPQPLGYSLILVEIITVKPAQNQNYQAHTRCCEKNLQDQILLRLAALFATSVVIVEIFSPVFRTNLLLGKRSPNIPRNRPLLAAYVDDKELALQSNKRRSLTVQ